jgi:hypothetical protein
MSKVGKGVFHGRHRESIEDDLILKAVVYYHPMPPFRFRDQKCGAGILGVAFDDHSFLKKILHDFPQYL